MTKSYDVQPAKNRAVQEESRDVDHSLAAPNHAAYAAAAPPVPLCSHRIVPTCIMSLNSDVHVRQQQRRSVR